MPPALLHAFAKPALAVGQKFAPVGAAVGEHAARASRCSATTTTRAARASMARAQNSQLLAHQNYS